MMSEVKFSVALFSLSPFFLFIYMKSVCVNSKKNFHANSFASIRFFPFFARYRYTEGKCVCISLQTVIARPSFRKSSVEKVKRMNDVCGGYTAENVLGGW